MEPLRGLRTRGYTRHEMGTRTISEAVVAASPVDGLTEPDSDLRPGLNVVGYFRAELGVGEAARRLLSGIERAGIAFRAFVYTAGTNSRQEHAFADDGEVDAVYDTNVICLNADSLIAFAAERGPRFFRGRYTIGVWWWEAPVFPASHPALDLVDELWVTSDYVSAALSAASTKSVQTIPLPVDDPGPDSVARTRAELGLPEGFMFLFMYDFFSVFERKNPLALIDAFKQAFAPAEGPVLVLKSINGAAQPALLALLREAASARPDISIVDGYVSADDRLALIASCDCYVSLHRSEGFGLTMAEAMVRGKPVIATGYSGNLAFMTEANSYLVPYRLTSIPSGCEPYPAGAHWADPDVETAASLIRHVFLHPEEAVLRGQRARSDVLATHSADALAAFVSRRMAEIRELRRAASPAAFDKPDALFAAAGAPLQQATALVEQGPTALGLAGSRFGAPVTLLRGLLGRLLWPYIAAQYELTRKLALAVEALQQELELERVAREQLSARVDDLERHYGASSPDAHSGPQAS